MRDENDSRIQNIYRSVLAKKKNDRGIKFADNGYIYIRTYICRQTA